MWVIPAYEFTIIQSKPGQVIEIERVAIRKCRHFAAWRYIMQTR